MQRTSAERTDEVRQDGDQSSGRDPFIWVSVNNKWNVRSAGPRPPVLPQPAFKPDGMYAPADGTELAQAMALWQHTAGVREMPMVSAIEGSAFAQFATRSLVFDIVEVLDDEVGGTLQLRRIGEELAEFSGCAIKAADGSELDEEFLLSAIQGHLKPLMQVKRPVTFAVDLSSRASPPTECNCSLLPFGDGQVSSIVAIFEQTASPTLEDGEDILNLEESAIVNGEESLSGVNGAMMTERVEGKAKPSPSGRTAPRSGASAAESEGVSSLGTDLSNGMVSDLITEARKSADNAREAEEKSRLAGLEALGRSYDLALWIAQSPEELAVQLVFGSDCSEEKIAEYVGILREARRRDVHRGELAEKLKNQDGGVSAFTQSKH